MTWDPPTDNFHGPPGRSPATTFSTGKAYAAIGVTFHRRTYPETSATIEDANPPLNEGTLYQVQVRAINNEGERPLLAAGRRVDQYGKP